MLTVELFGKQFAVSQLPGRVGWDLEGKKKKPNKHETRVPET